MGLSLELNAKLDVSGPLLNLEGNIAVSLSDLDAVNIPDFSADFSTASDNNDEIDISLIAQGVRQVLTNLNPIIGNLSGPIDIQSISKVVELAEQLNQVDIPNSLEQLKAEFEQGVVGNENFLATLGKFSDILEGNLSIQSAKSFIESLIEISPGTFGPGDLDINKFNAKELLPALESVVSLIGNLMSIWHSLEEGEKLAKVVQAQLDHERINAAINLVEKQIGAQTSSPLVAFLQQLDVSDDAQVAVAKRTISNVNNAVNGLHDAIAEGMAFGEATLIQLNPSGLKLSIQNSAAELGAIDTGQFEDFIEQIATHLQPLFLVDFNQAPVNTLDQWLTLLEGKTTELADGIGTYDIAALMSPINQGLEAILALPTALNDALQTLKLELQQSLNGIREAVESVPVDTLVDTIQKVLAPISTALEFISQLISNIQAVLETALATLQSALDSAEIAVDAIKVELEQVFQTVKTYIDSLALDQIIGEIAQQIQTFADALGTADMTPYFDQVTDVINTTTGVVDKVPFNLLPDSMEQEVVDLVKPIKEVNLDDLRDDIKDLLQIGEDGKFELRPVLDAALSAIQAKYDEVLEVVEQGNPQAFAEEINLQLATVQTKISELTPTVALEPIQEAIDSVKDVLSGFDLNQTLAPLNEGFDDIIDKVDEFKPSVLLEDLENSLTEARQSLFGSLRLDEWNDEILSLRQQAIDLLEPIDPSQLEPLLQTAVDEIKQKAADLPTKELAYAVGSFINGVLGGQAGQSRASSFAIILEWMESKQGTSQLVALANQASVNIDAAHQAASQISPTQIIVRLQPQLNTISAALTGLPDGAVKNDLVRCASQLSVETRLAPFSSLQQRYLQALQQASSDFTELANEGLSEVDLAVTKLQLIFQPLAFAKTFFVNILSLLGISGLEKGIQKFIEDVFAVATPKRLASIVTPIVTAFKDRVTEFIDGFLDPILNGIAEVQALEEQISLTSLIVELDAIHTTTRDQISQLHPNVILEDGVNAFTQAQTDVLAFDPLAPITTAIDLLKTSSTRVLGKLDAEQILETPIEVFGKVLASLQMIDLQNLLKPILDVLDSLSQKVSQGLDDTTDSFERLQDALPDQVGNTSISVSVSVST
ncbi:MAG: hypothetical protein ACI97K_001766 [Glaciecola sp.]|jgi:hypothetical protein